LSPRLVPAPGPHWRTSDRPAPLAALSGNESLGFSLRLCFSNDVCSVPDSGRTRNQRHGFMTGWGGAAVQLSRRAGTHLIQCGLCRGLLPYQVVSSCIQPFGHNRHEPKTRGLCPFYGGAATPSNTTSPGSRFTSVPSGILIHPTVWLQ